MAVAPVQNDQTGEQQGLVVVVVVVRASSYTSGQQDAPLPLVMEHQRQQRHHQDEDNGTADDGVGDARVVAHAIVQCHKVLPRGFCGGVGEQVGGGGGRGQENEEQIDDDGGWEKTGGRVAAGETKRPVEEIKDGEEKQFEGRGG